MPHFVRGADGKVPIAVFLSGRGSNLAALARATQRPDHPARIALVVSDNADGPGLVRARDAGLATATANRADYGSRAAFETALGDMTREAQAQIICLAGFMRILSRDFVLGWPERILNIHPSLLPAYRGLDTHAHALADGARRHGATVHLVSEGLDAGPILAQSALDVGPQDTAQTLAERVLALEHKLYPAALAGYIEGTLTPRPQPTVEKPGPPDPLPPGGRPC